MTPEPHVPLFRDPKLLLLDMAREHALPELLQMVVARIAESPRVALARIWLIQPNDTDLHLVASAGRSVAQPGVEWNRLDGAFRRIPLGARKVGRIAATGEPLEVPDLSPAPEWVARPEWIRAEGIAGFGGQPLVHRGQVLGVLA